MKVTIYEMKNSLDRLSRLYMIEDKAINPKDR